MRESLPEGISVIYLLMIGKGGRGLHPLEIVVVYLSERMKARGEGQSWVGLVHFKSTLCSI